MNHSKETIMAQAQVFASSWSMVGGPFDRGNEIKNAEAMKLELATMIEDVFQQRDELLVYKEYNDFTLLKAMLEIFDIMGNPAQFRVALEMAIEKRAITIANAKGGA